MVEIEDMYCCCNINSVLFDRRDVCEPQEFSISNDQLEQTRPMAEAVTSTTDYNGITEGELVQLPRLPYHAYNIY